jgi:hypothetical protein
MRFDVGRRLPAACRFETERRFAVVVVVRRFIVLRRFAMVRRLIAARLFRREVVARFLRFAICSPPVSTNTLARKAYRKSWQQIW